jgi:hypothetical protein
MLRNQNLIIGGIEPFPENAYAIDTRKIIPQNTIYVIVEIFIKRYADATKANEIALEPPIFFTLRNLPNDPALLNPTLYQSELLIQHGAEIVDGTALNDFIVL